MESGDVLLTALKRLAESEGVEEPSPALLKRVMRILGSSISSSRPDPTSTIGAIKGRLLRGTDGSSTHEQGPRDALRFQEVHQNLVRLGVPRQTTAVLHLLHEISDNHNRKDSATASVLSSFQVGCLLNSELMCVCICARDINLSVGHKCEFHAISLAQFRKQAPTLNLASLRSDSGVGESYRHPSSSRPTQQGSSHYGGAPRRDRSSSPTNSERSSVSGLGGGGGAGGSTYRNGGGGGGAPMSVASSFASLPGGESGAGHGRGGEYGGVGAGGARAGGRAGLYGAGGGGGGGVVASAAMTEQALLRDVLYAFQVKEKTMVEYTRSGLSRVYSNKPIVTITSFSPILQNPPSSSPCLLV